MEQNISHSLRHGTDPQLPKVQSRSFGVETVATVYVKPKMWSLMLHCNHEVDCTRKDSKSHTELLK